MSALSQRRPVKHGSSKQPRSGFASRGLIDGWDRLLPILVVTILCIPVLRLGYFWDDYFFLTFKGEAGPRVFLFPDPDGVFYRPVTQSLYFLFLRFFGDSSGLLGHVMNLAVLALSVGLLVSLVSKLRGRVAGCMAGLVFATFGHIPSVVAWVSCDQDLFAVAFLISALLLRHLRKDLAALACAAGALLSKEPALTFFPVLIFWDHLIGRRPIRILFHLATYGGLSLLWVLIHPGFRKLVLRGFESGATGYIGLTHIERGAQYLLRYVMTLVNVPATGFSTPWLADRVWAGVMALTLLLGGLWILHRNRAFATRAPKHVSVARTVLIALLLAIPALLLPAFLVRHWATYYASISAIGVALLLGTLLATMRPRYAAAFFIVFLPLGIWCRGMFYGERVAWTEQSFVTAAKATREVETNFKRLRPSLQPGSQVLVSVTSTGIRGISSTLLDGHALRIWYRDSKLLTLRPELYQRGHPAVLVRVTSNLSVVAIEPDSLRAKWTAGGVPHPWEINRPIRGYARGLAAVGETDHAIRILEGLARIEQGMERAYDHRLIAMIRLAEGRRLDAQAIMDTVDAFPWAVAVEAVKKLLTESSSNAGLDSCSFEAFGLSTSDPEVARFMMRRFWMEGWVPEAVHFAHRLEALKPGDPECAQMFDTSKGRPPRPL